jgi:uncharacterized protein (TIGR02452 family)
MRPVSTNRSDRATMAQQTLAILEAGGYAAASGAWISLESSMVHCLNATRLHEPEQLDALIVRRALIDATMPSAALEVRNETTLAGIARLVAVGDEPVAALNFASAKNPGGGFLGGSEAQEESLARSSALYASLLRKPSYYERHRATTSALYSDAVIVSPDCPVFRDDSGCLLERPMMATFITAAAPNAGALAANQPDLLPDVRSVLLHRAECVLALAASRGDRCIVLGAWGCGVFRNKPAMVADVFAELLIDRGWASSFAHVCFSILDRSSGGDVLSAFERRFE